MVRAFEQVRSDTEQVCSFTLLSFWCLYVLSTCLRLVVLRLQLSRRIGLHSTELSENKVVVVVTKFLTTFEPNKIASLSNLIRT